MVELAQGNPNDVGDDPGESTVRVDLGAGRTAVAVSAGDSHACAILDTGQARCWGFNAHGQAWARAPRPTSATAPARPRWLVDLGPGRTAVAGRRGQVPHLRDPRHRPACAAGATTARPGRPGQHRQGRRQPREHHSSGRPRGRDGQRSRSAPAATPPARSSTPATSLLGLQHLRAAAAGRHRQHRRQHQQEHAVNVGGQPLAGGERRRRSRVRHHRQPEWFYCWGNSTNGQLGLGQTTPYGDGPGETAVPPVQLPDRPHRGGGDLRRLQQLRDPRLRGAPVLGRQRLRPARPGQHRELRRRPRRVHPGGRAYDTPVRSAAVGSEFVCAVTGTGLRCWGNGGQGQRRTGQRRRLRQEPRSGPLPSWGPSTWAASRSAATPTATGSATRWTPAGRCRARCRTAAPMWCLPPKPSSRGRRSSSTPC